MVTNKKYVIAGGPGVGKSELIKALARIGYCTIPEIASEIIRQQRITDVQKLPTDERNSFRLQVIKGYVDLESKIPPNEICFQDRSLVDTVAYCRFEHRDCPDSLIEMLRTHRRYNTVFFLQPLPIYEQTETRAMTHEDALRLHIITKQIYEEFGYEIIDVPILPIEAREIGRAHV